MNWEKNSGKKESFKTIEYWHEIIATLELKEFITSSEDSSLIATKQQQYTSNSTSKCLEWTGGVLGNYTALICS